MFLKILSKNLFRLKSKKFYEFFKVNMEFTCKLTLIVNLQAQKQRKLLLK